MKLKNELGIVINPTPNRIINPPKIIGRVGLSPRKIMPPVKENTGSNNKKGATLPTS
jgi:hypothetical protein